MLNYSKIAKVSKNSEIGTVNNAGRGHRIKVQGSR
jgi:hypothetical protein